MKDLDPKSLIIGFLAAVLVTVAMGNALADKPVGKYQIAYHGKEEQMYIVNTTTGKLYKSSGQHLVPPRVGWDSSGQPSLFWNSGLGKP